MGKRGARPRHGSRRPWLVADGGGADFISDLPEDLLILVLGRLGCARTAARTNLLSRLWRGLWRQLNDFTFRDVPIQSLLPALRSLARVSNVFLLDIRVLEVAAVRNPLREQYAARVSSLLRAAAELSPAELNFGVPPCGKCDVVLPSFVRATSIELHGLSLLFAELPARNRYMFPVLETLCLSHCMVEIDVLALHCPRLRVFRVSDNFFFESIIVRSASLQELVVDCRDNWIGRIDLQVPALKQLVLSILVDNVLSLYNKLSVSVSVPLVEKVSWHCWYSRFAAGISLWGLGAVTLEMENNVLCLEMESLDSYPFPRTELNLAQEIGKHLLAADFSVLDLQFETAGHSIGAFLFCFLRIHQIRTATKILKIGLQNILGKEKSEACSINCVCDEPKNWRSQTIISLINLEEVEIKGFQGEDYEFDILRLLFKCAPMLKRMTVKLSDEVATSKAWCTKIDDIFKEYPFVECSVNPSTGPTRSSRCGVET